MAGPGSNIAFKSKGCDELDTMKLTPWLAMRCSVLLLCAVLGGCDPVSVRGLEPLPQAELDRIRSSPEQYMMAKSSHGAVCFKAGKQGVATRILCGGAFCFAYQLSMSFEQFDLRTKKISRIDSMEPNIISDCSHDGDKLAIQQADAVRREIMLAGEMVIE
jgi:hypothetical protein